MKENQSDMLARVTAQAGAEIQRIVQSTHDSYYHEQTMSMSEMVDEFAQNGHFPPGDGCMSPTCQKARAMYAAAMQAVQGGQQ